jgi:mannose-6-phosphate isomerase-like protein (cupin superfamily)
MAFSTVHLEDIEPAGPGGIVRFVRRELGCEAFGINHFSLPPNATGREHDETGSKQEEISFVVEGDGHWVVDGVEVPVRAGSFIRIDPESRRVPVAGTQGLTFVSIGAARGSYEPRGAF